MGKGWILKKSPLDRKALRLITFRCRGEGWRGPGLRWQTQLLPLQDCEERKGARHDDGGPLGEDGFPYPEQGPGYQDGQRWEEAWPQDSGL